MVSLCPCIPDYRSMPFDTAHRPAMRRILSRQIVTPVADTEDYHQRDINEALSRGWVKRMKQRPHDKAWYFTVTPAGRAALEEM